MIALRKILRSLARVCCAAAAAIAANAMSVLWSLWAAAAISGLSAPTLAVDFTPAVRSLDRAIDVAQKMIEAKRVAAENFFQPQVDISPDGRKCVYVVVEPTIRNNEYITNVWLSEIGKTSQSRIIGNTAASATGNSIVTPRFSPDGARVAFLKDTTEGIRLSLVDLASGKSRVVSGTAGLKNAWQSSWKIRADGGLQWSPDGRHIAVGVLERDGLGKQPRVSDTDLVWAENVDDTEAGAIAVIDADSGKSELIRSEGLYIHDFEWSPNGAKFAISASPRESARSRWMYTDIYVLDIASRRLEPMVVQPGMDWQPAWSPDGERIAFLSSGGVLDWSQRNVVGVVETKTHSVAYPDRSQILAISAEARSRPVWRSGGRSIVVQMMSNLSQAIYVVPIDGGALRVIHGPGVASYDNARIARDNNALVYTRQTFEEPRDLYIMSPDDPYPDRLTDFGGAFRSKVQARASSENVVWRSSDGRWNIHGGLFTTMRVESDHKNSTPLLVFAEGGPTMVRMSFNLNGQFPFIAFAESGVAVFAPNTRGRSGFGKEFLSALAEEGHWGSGPLSDIIEGMDYVSRTRCVGRDGKVGIVGHSYGGYLAAFAITRSDRFRAAEIFDSAGPPLFPGDLYKWGANPQIMGIMKALYGIGSPFDSSEYTAIEQESPLPHIKDVRTPTLLEYGSVRDKSEGAALFHGLRHFGVPTEFIRYRDIDHRLSEFGPAEQMDGARRNLEWYWYWVLGERVPNLIRAYGEPRGVSSKANNICSG